MLWIKLFLLSLQGHKDNVRVKSYVLAGEHWKSIWQRNKFDVYLVPYV